MHGHHQPALPPHHPGPGPHPPPDPPAGRAAGRGREASDLITIAIGVPLTAVLLWWIDGGPGWRRPPGRGLLTGVGQLAGFASGLAALARLALAARPASVERRFGLDRMLGWHRWIGMVAAFALMVHVVALLAAYSMRSGTNPVSEVGVLFGQTWMPAAMAGGALMGLVALSSWRRIKSRMAYETWYYLHLLGYLAVALALRHVLVMGSDFAGNTVAQAWWLALYAGVAWLIGYSRIRPLLRSLRQPLKVTGIETLPDGSLSIWVSGPSLARWQTAPGQFFSLRFATRGLWWQSHPSRCPPLPSPPG